jgi:hypothetical protein
VREGDSRESRAEGKRRRPEFWKNSLGLMLAEEAEGGLRGCVECR